MYVYSVYIVCACVGGLGYVHVVEQHCLLDKLTHTCRDRSCLHGNFSDYWKLQVSIGVELKSPAMLVVLFTLILLNARMYVHQGTQ